MRKNLLLTSLLMLVATLGIAQSATWPITLTKADGLPGKYSAMNYEFYSNLYSFDEAISTLRFTVISTNTVEEQTGTGTDGVSKGWGPGYPFFTLTELTVLDANGDTIPYTPVSNAVAVGDGSIEALNNGNMTDHFHTTYNKGELPQAYHYIDLQFESPIKEFKINWVTRKNIKNMPTYVGLTPGTDYTSYPELGLQIEKKVTDAADFAEEGAFYVIKNNAGNFYDEEYTREYQGGGYYISPYGAPTLLDASAIVYLIPNKEKENTYKVKWLSHGRYMGNQPLPGYYLAWTTVQEDAADIKFVPCEAEGAEGDFFMTQHDSVVVYHNKKGKMATALLKDSLVENSPEYSGYNMSIYKVAINVGNTVSMLDALVTDAEARVAQLGDLGEYNQGEYEDMLAAIETAKALQANPTTASDILKAKLALEKAVPAYAVVAMNLYLDSLDYILGAIQDEEILLSEAPDWIPGSYHMDSEEKLNAAVDAASLVLENYKSISDVDAGIEAAIAAIDAFWASKIENIKTLPFRLGVTEDGLPGEMQSYGGYYWESPMFRLSEVTDVLRFTIIKTNNMGVYKDAAGSTKYVFPTFAEFEIYDGEGNKIELTADNFSSNSIHPTDGIGLAGLCDGDNSTHYHAAYKVGHDSLYDQNVTYVYIEVALPEAISSFKYVQWGRKNGVNTPTDFIISAGGEAVTPEDVPLVYKYPAAVGEKITDPAQLVDGEFYAIQGLYSCDPVNCFGEEPEKPHFFSGSDVFGTQFAPDAVFQFKKTGDADGSFYIRSLKDSKYWSNVIDNDGWGHSAATENASEAAKVLITPRGNDGHPGSMVLYQYNDTVHREYNDQGDIPTPYLVFQDWGEDLAVFSVPTLDANDADGEGEWYIYKVNMERPYSYWLSQLMPVAASYKDAQVGIDPGFFTQESAGAFVPAYKKAETAVLKDTEAAAKEVVAPLLDALAKIKTAEKIPVTAGTYMLISAYEEFYKQQGVEKAIYAYYNDAKDDSYIGDLKYRVFWANAPEGRTNVHERFQFRLVSVPADEPLIAEWREAGTITAEDSLNAYYFQHVETGYYIKGANALYCKIGLTETPETPFVVRKRGEYSFDFFSPSAGDYIGYRSLQLNGHGSGGGKSGVVTTWDPTFTSAAAYAARFYLRKIDDGTSIGGVVINGSEQGDEVVSVSYYTTAGTAVATPVKGAINIVKKVYKNGVVESSKVFVK